jgi:hypothetical protein
MLVQFAAVKTVLDNIIAGWTAGNNAPPNLGKHGPTFGWNTRDQLLASVAKGIPLIQPEIIGHKGMGQTANIVVDLTAGIAPFPQMPYGGLDSTSGNYLALGSPEIQTIVDWIEGGCLP